MNIYALKGHKVKCVTFSAGYDSEQKEAKELLEIGKVYEVERTFVDSWHTKVYLKEFPGRYFNSVFFADVKKQSKKNDKLHECYPRFNFNKR